MGKNMAADLDKDNVECSYTGGRFSMSVAVLTAGAVEKKCSLTMCRVDSESERQVSSTSGKLLPSCTPLS